MSAPELDSATSVSSSGHTDGLGRRELCFDRETGAMLEHLHVRPELHAFEAAIRERVERLAAFDDPRFARILSVERAPKSGELTVVSDFIPGLRLTYMLETARDEGLVPGVDAALGYLLEALSALAAFHLSTGGPHGLVAPERTIFTDDNQLVFLDPAYAAVVDRLALSRRRLWTTLGIAAPVSGPVHLDVACDLSQAALSAVMLTLGRPLEDADYPDNIPSLLTEIVEVAQIRGTAAFADGFQQLFQRLLPLSGRRPFDTADDALADLRVLLQSEIGAEACTQALTEFLRQLNSPPVAVAPLDVPLEEEDEFAAPLDAPEADYDAPSEATAGDEPAIEFELNLDEHVEPGLAGRRDDPDVDEVFELGSYDLKRDLGGFATTGPPVAKRRFEAAPPPMPLAERPPEAVLPSFPSPPAESEPLPLETPFSNAGVRTNEELVAAPSLDPTPPDSTPEAAPLTDTPLADHDQGGTSESSSPKSGSHRRKRQSQKSARARKDKLRSTTIPEVPPPLIAAPVPAAAEAASPSKSGWLIPQDQSAKFETAPPPLVAPRPVPVVSYQQTAAPLPAAPSFPALATPNAGMPRVGTPGPSRTPVSKPAPPAPAPAALESVIRLSPVQVKVELPPGYSPTPKSKRGGRELSPRFAPEASPAESFQAPPKDDTINRGFPWKLAMAAVVLVGVAVVAGRAYLPGGAMSNVPAEAAAAALPAAEPETNPGSSPSGTGQIVIKTQPAGAAVLLDGKPAGESPVTLRAVTAGRHIITLVSSSGSIKRTVRVVSGKAVTLDLPIFSGWIAVFAPFVVEISEGGKALGTTEQGRIMVAPGRHDVVLTNADLGFSATQSIEVAAGDVSAVHLDPQGRANINAIPWAEVWLDGRKIGDTPMASYELPLGSREFVFKHPQFGERKVAATIRAGAPTTVVFDFTRQPQP